MIIILLMILAILAILMYFVNKSEVVVDDEHSYGFGYYPTKK